MDPTSAPYLCFRIRGKIYYFCRLPLGLSWSPYVFVKTTAPLIRAWRGISPNLHVAPFLDDFLFLLPSKLSSQEVQHLVLNIQRIAAHLGWRLHPTKSIFTPQTTIQFLGFLLHSTPIPAISLPSHRVQNVLKELRRTSAHIQKETSQPVRSLARLAGLISSSFLALLPAHLLSAPLLRLVSPHVRKHGWRSSLVPPRSLLHHLQKVYKIFKMPELKRSIPLIPLNHHYLLTTDASEWGWGAVLQNSSGSILTELQDQWKLNTPLQHSNVREALAILNAIKALAPRLQNSNLRIQTDNITALAMLSRWTSRSIHVQKIASDLIPLLDHWNIKICAPVHIPGCQNTRADSLSRSWTPQRKSVEWPMDRQWVDIILTFFRLSKKNIVDRFATASNTISTRFNSLLPSPGAEALNGLAQNWSTELNWINPPFSLMQKVVSKLQNSVCSTSIVIAPNWPTAPWFATLSTMACDKMPVPTTAVLYGSGMARPEPLKNLSWSMTAFLVKN